jgi:hypothetical protein
MIETLLKPILSAVGGLTSVFLNRPQLRIFCGWQNHTNADQIGNYLALDVKIANKGTKSLYFERLELRTTTGETYYPIFAGVSSNTEIKPNASVVGHIPVGHVANQRVIELRVYDAVERVFSLRGRRLLEALRGLEQESVRLEQLGFEIHPTSNICPHSVVPDKNAA